MARSQGIRAINHVLECQWCGASFESHRSDTKRCAACDSKPAIRLPPIVLPRPDSHDLAWAAGFFDGEGCFTAGGRGYLQLSVAQKLPSEPIERFASLFGVGRLYYWSRPNRSGEFATYMVHGRKAFYVADLLWPWLGEQKRARFKRVLLETERRPRKSRGQRYVYEAV